MNDKFFEDFEFFTKLILSDKNFAYARYADGEVAVIQGRAVDTNSQAFVVDRWKSDVGVSVVAHQLLESLSHTEENYYYAISAPSDSVSDYSFLKSHIKTGNITFANLWINANYQKMKKFYETFTKPAYILCNHRANKQAFPFKILDHFPFPDNCIDYWLHHGDDYILQLLDYTTNVQNQTFFISCGPISEILIHRMYTTNPNNQYIDVGSSIDEFVHGVKTRPYMHSNSQYSKEVSAFSI